MAPSHWFEPLAEHLGEAYLRYSFTMGTTQEVGFLIEELHLRAGQRLVDVGCGPGRHALALAEHGLDVVGVDISAPFVRIATQRADDAAPLRGTFVAVRGDATMLPLADAFADVVISLCQGGFGLLGGPGSPLDHDVVALAEMARVVRPGGLVLVSAFSAYFQLRYLEETDSFDAERGVNHERTELRNAAGKVHEAALWTTTFTPRELRLMAGAAGLVPVAVWAVTPGRYAAAAPDIDQPEFVLLATRPDRP